MPLHAGHIALIEFAAMQCDELIVSMSFTKDDPISHQQRFDWIQAHFQNRRNILPRLIADDFDQPDLPLVDRTKIWSQVISKVYSKIDVVISSEEYGEPFAQALGAKHIEFDRGRIIVAISASLIRNQPFKYWQFIPDVVRPYFVKTVCFYGAESTGKSTMAIKMAEKYHTVFVPEVAREMLVTNDFTENDIIKIGDAQYQRILEAKRTANKILFCDTDVLTTQIYSQHYLHVIPPVLFDLEKRMVYDKYFLFDIDVPWVSDGLRDLGDQREKMHRQFKEALVKRNLPFVKVQGSWAEREAIISNEIERLLMDE
jgi:HTH-type transcriptional regulator, transcriptional repressor of NAD biosynthesis genes